MRRKERRKRERQRRVEGEEASSSICFCFVFVAVAGRSAALVSSISIRGPEFSAWLLRGSKGKANSGGARTVARPSLRDEEKEREKKGRKNAKRSTTLFVTNPIQSS